MPWVAPPEQHYFPNSQVIYETETLDREYWNLYANNGTEVGARLPDEHSIRVAHTFNKNLQYVFRLSIQLDKTPKMSGIYLCPLLNTVSDSTSFKWTLNKENSYYVGRSRNGFLFSYYGLPEHEITNDQLERFEKRKDLLVILSRNADGQISVQTKRGNKGRILYTFQQASAITNDLWAVAENEMPGRGKKTSVKNTRYEIDTDSIP